MTELQLGLIGLGATAVVGVFGYNKWQEYRQRKLAESAFKPQHADVLLDAGEKTAPPAAAPKRSEKASAPAERLEPVFAKPQSLPDEDEFMVEEGAEVSAEQFAPMTVGEPPTESPLLAEDQDGPDFDLPAGAVPAELLDPRLEFVVAMELVETVLAGDILRSQRDVLHRLNKPVHWVGFNERSREWERLVTGSELPVRRLRVGLQLVNRLGPVSDGDVTIFTNAMRALADELMAVADMPSSRVLDQAAEIDRFCAAVDLEIGINLVSRVSAFSGTKIRSLAEAAGMQLGIDGLFTRYDEQGHAQFSLQNFETTQFSSDSLRSLTTHGLTFLLDVPRVAHGERIFGQMSELAKRFAETLQGALVDDNRQPLSDSQLDHIRREFIGKPQATMLSFGLPAGSPQAQRLFS
jgi:hypothetical protein